MGIFDKLGSNIEKLEAKRNVKGLIKDLKHEDMDIRLKAAESLGRIREIKATGPLIKTLKDKNEDVQREAAEALRKIGKSAEELLIQALKSKDPNIGYYVTGLLGIIGGKRALEALIKVFKDKKRGNSLRGNAASAISSFRGRKLKLAVIAPLADGLYDVNTCVRWQAAQALTSIRDVRAARCLMKAVMDRNPNISDNVISGISRGRYDEFFLSTIKKLRSILGEEAKDCCAIARFLRPFGKSEDKFLEKEIEKAIKKSPNYAPAHCLLGSLWLRRLLNFWVVDKEGKYSDLALKELRLAIKLDPKDPKSYYVTSNLTSLPFNERRKYYERALKLDLYRSKAFGSYHWCYAMEAAEEKARGLSGDAFTRAVIVDADRYKEGPLSVMPAPGAANGWAQVWWNAAKDEAKRYQDKEEYYSLEGLWKQGH